LAFTGSGSVSSAVAFDKESAKKKLVKTGILLAEALCVTVGVESHFEKLTAFFLAHGNVVCKPQCDGSSVGLAFLSSLQELSDWWKKVAPEQRNYIVEERLFGREFTVGVVDLGKGAQPLPVSEVVITNPGGAFDYEGKYLGRGTKEITPAVVTSEELAALQKLGVTAHSGLGCFGYSRTDVILGPKGAYFLETNTLPGLTRASFIPQQLSAAGISMTEFLTAQVRLAEQRRKQL
jgi:D-alanine-D-alanine ligase